MILQVMSRRCILLLHATTYRRKYAPPVLHAEDIGGSSLREFALRTGMSYRRLSDHDGYSCRQAPLSGTNDILRAEQHIV